jgi:hypothetical protein
MSDARGDHDSPRASRRQVHWLLVVTFRFAGMYEHVERALRRRRRRRVRLLALCHGADCARSQQGRECISTVSGGAISSGAWGCGAFGGDFAAKTVQMLAASAVTDTFLFLSAMNDASWPTHSSCIDAAVDAELTVGDCARMLLAAQQARQSDAAGIRKPTAIVSSVLCTRM